MSKTQPLLYVTVWEDFFFFFFGTRSESRGRGDGEVRSEGRNANAVTEAAQGQIKRGESACGATGAEAGSVEAVQKSE